MSTKFFDRVAFTTTTSGTSTITVGSAVPGYLTLSGAGIPDTTTVRYVVVDGINWEIGLGVTGGTGTTLTRGATESSNGGTAISLSGGVSTVFLSHVAADILVGTNTNDNAASGYIGEYISSNIPSASAISLTSTAIADITSISLTAGDWDTWGNVEFIAAGTTVPAIITCWINNVSATAPTDCNSGMRAALSASFATGGLNFLPAGYGRWSLASTTTIYLTCKSVFTVSTMTAAGFIGARRIR